MPQRATFIASLAAAVGLLAGLAGCSVAVVGPASDDVVVNDCGGDDECTNGLCVDGRCQARGGIFSTLLVEISPPASGDPDFAGVDYLHRLDNLASTGGYREINLARPVQVTGTVSIDPYLVGDELCELSFLADDSLATILASAEGIPVSVSFTPSDRILGVASTTYTADVDTAQYEAGFQAPPLSFDITVPPGDYDIYIQPRAPAPGGCDIPPTLLRRFEVETNDLILGLDLPTPATFELTVQWPAAITQKKLVGWTVDMLDPLTGRVISTKSAFGDPQSVGSHVEYTTSIAYAPVTLEESESELVRLSPPEGVDAPTVVLARSVLELFSPGTGIVDQFLDYPDPVDVEGQLTLAGEASPSSGTVTVVSTSIDGVGEGVFASFVRSAEADADGRFTMRLLPGKYRVYAAPGTSSTMTSSGTLIRAGAASETEWEIAAEPELQAGKTVELFPPAHVTGIAYLPLQSLPATGATVAAVASPQDTQVDLLTQAAHGNLAFAPAAQSSIVNGDGFFDVQADPGVFDISVRPPEGTGFAWYVASRVVVKPAATSDTLEQKLGNINLPLPVPYTGRVVVPVASETSVPIPDALLRAYVYLDRDGIYTSDETKAASVVQIGETRADADGNFELLIPANLN